MASTLPAPTGLECEATSSRVRFSWDEVPGADSYAAKIQLAVPGSAQTQMHTASTEVVFTGLAASTRYWVSVLAVKNGEPQRFSGVYCTTLADIAAPTLTCAATATSVTVSWEAVTGATRYRAKAGDGNWTADIAATTHTFAGLAPATVHTITVQSGDAAGWGGAAAVRCVTAAAGVYCDDTTSNSIVLEWDPIAAAQYWYASVSGGGGYSGPRTDSRLIRQGNTTEFTGLEKATRYVLLLWWYDGDEWHETNPPPECWTKHLDTPVLADEYTTGGNTLTIQWDPVEGAQRFQAQISPAGAAGQDSASGQSRSMDSESWTTVVSTGAFHSFTGLMPGTEYTVQLRAVDPKGNTSAATRADRMTSRVKCKAATTSSVTLEWDDPDDEYQWRIGIGKEGSDSNLRIKIISAGTGTETTFDGLDSHTEYSLVVERRIGVTAPWEKLEPTTHCHTSPNSPVLTPCPQAADIDGTIRWESNGAYYYRITLDHTQADSEWIITNSTSHTFTNLAEGKTYDIAVQAWNPQGWSENSTCKDKMKTLPSIPNGRVTGTGTYHFTEGTVKGVLYAAGQAISNRNGSISTEQVVCGNPGKTMTKIQLAAIMLSIPPSEAYGADSQSAVPSPMILSRWDNLGQFFQTHIDTVGGIKKEETKSLNIRLYSHMTEEGDLGAHWSPGVGLWQIDFFGPAINLNHAERATITHGGVGVATLLLNAYCADTANEQVLRNTLNGRWHGCHPFARDENGNMIKDPNDDTKYLRILDVCYDRYSRDKDKIYETSTNDSRLNIEVVKKDGQGVALDQVDGGVASRQCRWSSENVPMLCHVYDTGNPQGITLNDDPTGTNTSMTPYPSAFISFTDPDTDIKYAVWPSKWPSSVHDVQWPTETVSSAKSIYRAVMPDEYVRCSPGRDMTPESSNSREAAADCAEEIFKPFGMEIRNSNFDNGKHVVEGWFDDLVPFAEDQYHKLQLENCGTLPGVQSDHTFCWWDDI